MKSENMKKMIADAELYIKDQIRVGNDALVKEIAWKFIIGEQIVKDNRLDPEVMAAVEDRLRRYQEQLKPKQVKRPNIVTSADI